MEQILTLDELHRMIGSRVRYDGSVYEIIEVLDDEHGLVLQDVAQHTTIQADQHGEAHRRVPQTLTVHIPHSDDGKLDLSALRLEMAADKPA